MGKYTFHYCLALESINIPERITVLRNSIFGSCTALKSVYLPFGLMEIDNYVFFECDSLSDVYYAGSEEDWQTITIKNYNEPLLNATIHLNYHEHSAADPVRENETAATCTAAGSYDEVVYCTRCTYEFSRSHVTIDPLNHANAYDVPATEPTATEHGYTAGEYCTACKVWVSGHEVVHNAFGAQTVIKPATEEEEGLVDIVCTVCGETVRYTAEKLPHTEPQPSGTGDSGNGFWMRIQSFFRGIIDWFLRLFKWLGR